MHGTVHLCIYCAAEINSTHPDCTMEHIIPLDAGGANNIANTAPACLHCNRDKNNLLPDEWLNILLRRYEDAPTVPLLHQVLRTQLIVNYATRMGDKLYRK